MAQFALRNRAHQADQNWKLIETRSAIWIKKEPGLTLEELTAKLATNLIVHVHHTTVMRALFKWGYRYKKNSLRQGANPG